MKKNTHTISHKLHQLSLSVFLATSAVAATSMVAQPAFASSWQINLQDADIKAFINQVSDITGKNFVLDPRISGRVTVISNRSLNQSEVYDLFLGVLDVNGIVAINQGKSTKLVPSNVAKKKGIQIGSANRYGDDLVTRVVKIKNTRATEILPVLRPLLPQFAHIAVVPSINTLVISNKSKDLNRLVQLVEMLDGNQYDNVSIVELKHHTADAMLELISKLTSVRANRVSSQRLKVVADESNNRLIVSGSKSARVHILNLVSQLDGKPNKKLGGLRVYKLKYASADHVAQMLQGLLSNQSLTSGGSSATLRENTSLSGSRAGNSNRSATRTSLRRNSQTNKKDKPFSIIADKTQNAIVVNAPSDIMQDIELAIESLDTRRAQVLIKAAIIEVFGDSNDQLGIQWLVGGPDKGFGISNFQTGGANIAQIASAAVAAKANPTGVSSALSQVSGALFGLGDINKNNEGQASFYGAILQAIKTTSKANLLSMPSILTLDNEQANILIGQNVPFITGSTTTNGNGTSTPYQTIERKDVGINLTVVPHVGENGTVRLEVSQEVSSVVPTTNNVKSSDIITNRRYIKTTILANNEQTVALGGLMSDDKSESASKVPLLGDIPLLGALFRTTGSTGKKRNLIVFLQPTILYNDKELSQVSSDRYESLRELQLELDGSGNLTRLPLPLVNNKTKEQAQQVNEVKKDTAAQQANMQLQQQVAEYSQKMSQQQIFIEQLQQQQKEQSQQMLAAQKQYAQQAELLKAQQEKTQQQRSAQQAYTQQPAQPVVIDVAPGVFEKQQAPVAKQTVSPVQSVIDEIEQKVKAQQATKQKPVYQKNILDELVEPQIIKSAEPVVTNNKDIVFFEDLETVTETVNEAVTQPVNEVASVVQTEPVDLIQQALEKPAQPVQVNDAMTVDKQNTVVVEQFSQLESEPVTQTSNDNLTVAELARRQTELELQRIRTGK